MINYADYNFYKNEYKGNSLSVDLFNSFIVKASREIDKNINKDLTEETIAGLSEKEKWQLKYVACELCDFLKNSGGNSGVYGTGAGSISIDGISINKTSAKKSETQINKDKSNIIGELPLSLIRYL